MKWLWHKCIVMQHHKFNTIIITLTNNFKKYMLYKYDYKKNTNIITKKNTNIKIKFLKENIKQKVYSSFETIKQ